MPQITIVVPARNAAATIGRALAALAAQTGDVDCEVIVVDSGSSDGTVAIATASPVVSRVLHNPGGEPAGSRNLGVAHGSGRILAFTDADCEPAPGWLIAGMSALAEADIVQGKVLPRTPWGPFDRSLTVTSEYGLYETANLFVRRETFDRVGGFRSLLSAGAGAGSSAGAGLSARPFGEDAWFVWRARRTGARTAFCADAVVHHEVFSRGVRGFLEDCARRAYFPPLVALIPELRAHFLHHRWFLTAASMQFDLGLAGVGLGLVARRRWPAVLGSGFYAAQVALQARRSAPKDRARIVVGRVLGDVVTSGALARGSLRARTLVL